MPNPQVLAFITQIFLNLPQPGVAAVPLFNLFDSHLSIAQEQQQQATQPRGWMWGATDPTAVIGLYKTAYFTGWRDQCHASDDCTWLPLSQRVHDITWYRANHPDWIVYACDQTTWVNYNGDGIVAIDITNLAVRQYMLSLGTTAIAAGYQGVALDNMDVTDPAAMCGHYVGATPNCGSAPSFCGTWHADYSGAFYDTAWASSVLDYANWMHQQLNHASIALMMNDGSIEAAAGDGQPAFQAMQNAMRYLGDGSLSEGAWLNGCTGGGTNNYYQDNAWQVNFASDAAYAARGWYSAISYLCNETVATIAPADEAWIAANFLLVKGPNSYLWAGGGGEGGQPQTYASTWEPNCGAAAAAAQAIAGLTFPGYSRTFAGCLVVVNPNSVGTLAYTVPAGSWKDQFGNTVAAGPQTLNATTGIVLVKQ